MSCPTKDGWKKFTFTQHEKSEMHKEALKIQCLDPTKPSFAKDWHESIFYKNIHNFSASFIANDSIPDNPIARGAPRRILLFFAMIYRLFFYKSCFLEKKFLEKIYEGNKTMKVEDSLDYQIKDEHHLLYNLTLRFLCVPPISARLSSELRFSTSATFPGARTKLSHEKREILN
uniref:Uncharacterized protein n=1 Tax=Romanomermis culicivorax TaxID=13658 RepID=A0A915KE01_ROMCU